MDYEFKIHTIGNNKGQPLISDLEQRLQWIKQRGYEINISQFINEDQRTCIIDLRLRGNINNLVFRDEDIIYIFKHQLSESLAEHIMNNWENELLWKEIQRNCRRYSNEEKDIIFEKSVSFMSRCHDNESLNLLMNYGRKNRITRRIFDYMGENRQIVVEGFINFCLREYLNELKFSVEVACEELKNQKEYNDFINLLRYFVDSQVPRMQEVNLMIGEKGTFYLWDGEGTKIDEHFMNYYLEDMLVEEINLDDVLVSILITISPCHIILHNTMHMEPSEPVQTIRKVFKERISECCGCERCKNINVKPSTF
ncbi:putative sporulation protein YtxC [Syntrophomonas palmitatica]|uniref:putative sporulation protein YtxC n=1 Tax=Syntrophomonas palmitatica TaxID=402877 RepID=UPI0006CF4295|nr:putative sporulation protein YtxC [Syntrophomonas palmitatica]